MIRLPALLIGACAAPLAAQAPFLSLPVDCEIGKTCFIQQYVDHDPGPGQRDFTCGAQANDGHRGTDFRVATWAEAAKGVPVIASADGTVRATRDGMPDIPMGAAGAPDIEGRECGNAVVIDHQGGWQTTYCHLKQGSLTVNSGDVVLAGTQIAQIGASGATEFPHLHLTLRRDGEVVDPFKPQSDQSCGVDQTVALWLDPPTLEFGGLLVAGFSTGVPEFDDIKAGILSKTNISANGPALVLWGFFYASRTGDVIDISINGPENWNYQQSETLNKPQAQLFRAAGRRAPEDGFPKGLYTGKITLSRDGKVADEIEVKTKLE